MFKNLLESMLSVGSFIGGKSDGRIPEDFYQEQLKIGIEVEKEHTPDEELAKKIAMDHLTEMPDYYTKLKEMEKKNI